MLVLKFGGTSVGSPSAIRQLTGILTDYHRRGERFTVVFSAFSRVTDTLLELAQRASRGDEAYREGLAALRQRHVEVTGELLDGAFRHTAEAALHENFVALADMLHGVSLVREASARTLDFIASFGERNSTFVLTQVLCQAGLPADYLDARQVVRTDAQFGHAKVDFEETNRLVRERYARDNNTVWCVTGFIGSTADNLTTTLGRGGSDYTAAILGAALHARAVEIWTDVDGVLTADPRRVRKAFSLPAISYREAMEMSHFGAKVIYPPTIQPAMQQHIPIFIKNTFNPDHAGTRITAQAAPPEGSGERHPVTGISSINQICLLTLQGSGLFGVPGSAARLFGALARGGVNVVIITQASSESSITFAVSPGQADEARRAAEREFAAELRDGLIEPLRIERDLAVVAAVGENMRYQPGISGRLFTALGKNGINVVAVAQGSSELNITVVVAAADETKALNAIHETFFLSDTKTLHLFLVGTGLIGSTLLAQIARQAAFLREKRRLELRLTGLANSRLMCFDPDGLDMEHWKNTLERGGESFQIGRYVEKMRALNLPNSIFIDCTASETVAGWYDRVLEESISISTPNKVAAASPYENYRRLKQLADRRNVLWRYETNVGAGLPIITTLNDLLHSGDRLVSIEGVLSGTLSYIFNNFNGGQRFSEVVRDAQRRGLTEPDPRDDLSGADVRRKLLILAREAGWPLEAGDVTVDPLLPPDCLSAPTVAAFYEALARHDAAFERRRAEAESSGQALRFVARLEDGRATVVLRAYEPTHPFFFLSGSDNMVVFTTERYRERPLVVRGPGAGAEVTAAGVFAEVIGIGTYLS